MQNPLAISLNRLHIGGGMESYTLDLITYLSNQYAITVYANRFDDSLPQMVHITPHIISQKWIPKKLRPIVFSWQLNRIRSPNIPLIACNRSENATVFICGGTHQGHLNSQNKTPNPLDKLTLYREKNCYRTAKIIMAHSHLIAQELQQLYDVPPDKIVTLHPPVDQTRFYHDSSDNANIRAKYGFKDNEIIFLFPSTGHTRKGLPLLAKFFAHTDLPIKLAVAGNPLPYAMKNVIELGKIRDMPNLYRAADYTIMASIYEPFGLIGVESVLCGTRVLLANNMGCCEVLTQDDAGWFFNRDSQASLTHAIQQAVLLAQKGEHKINKINNALCYNPSMEYHIQKLEQMLI